MTATKRHVSLKEFKMNKGQTIKKLISEGMSNDNILLMVDTTLNSVRWYRSKMNKQNTNADSLLGRINSARFYEKRAVSETVGQAAERFGLLDELREACERLNQSQMFAEMCSWNFKVNKTSTSWFGVCNYGKRLIECHETLLDKPIDLRVTFFHECAHALDKMIHGVSSGHGRNWKTIMIFGFLLDAKRCGDKTGEASQALNDMRAVKAIETWICGKCGGGETHILRKRKYPANMYQHKACGGKMMVKG